MRQARTRLTAWIAILAMLWGAFAPGMVRATADPFHAAPWTEICTASADSLPVGGIAPDGGTQSHGGKHCPWCANHAGGFALPATDFHPPEVQAAAEDRLAAPVEHHRPQSVITLPPARAPPAFS